MLVFYVGSVFTFNLKLKRSKFQNPLGCKIEKIERKTIFEYFISSSCRYATSDFWTRPRKGFYCDDRDPVDSGDFDHHRRGLLQDEPMRFVDVHLRALLRKTGAELEGEGDRDGRGENEVCSLVWPVPIVPD